MNYRKTWSSIHQPVYLLWALLALAGTELIRKIIRPYVWEQGFNDLGLLGCMPSFLYSFGIILAMLGIRNWGSRDYAVVVMMSVLGVIYEYAQIFRGPTHTYDIWDVWATLSAGLLAYAFHKIHLSYRTNILLILKRGRKPLN